MRNLSKEDIDEAFVKKLHDSEYQYVFKIIYFFQSMVIYVLLIRRIFRITYFSSFFFKVMAVKFSIERKVDGFIFVKSTSISFDCVVKILGSF